jgi:tetratricopeptide (TPR) repeat protein
LQFAAPAGGVLVSAATHRATVRTIDYEAAAQERAWRPLAPRSRIGVAVEAPAVSAESPLIERETELRLLGGLLARVRGELEPQLVTLIGAPGIGKTRLVRELGRLVERDPELIYWRQGRSLPYGEGGEGMTLWALGEVVKAHAGILDTDDAATAEGKLQRAVKGALGDAADAATVERHLRPLVRLEPSGYPPERELARQRDRATEVDAERAWAGEVDGPARQREATMARARFLEALASDRPLVLVFEDLQWADDKLLDFVEALPETVGPVPLLVVGTSRPELLERRSGWGGGKRNATTVSLTPLSTQGSTELLTTLLRGRDARSDIPDDLMDLLLTKAGGNPLFLEEYVRMLRDLGFGPQPSGESPSGETPSVEMTSAQPTAEGMSGQAAGRGEPVTLPLPETVHQLIAARIDALTAGERALLTDLAVIGEQGWVGLVAVLGGVTREEAAAGLARLERRDLVRHTRAASVAGEAEYVFRHTLIRDVAYSLLLRAERAAKHRQVAEWLAGLSPDRMGDRAELLAYHLRQAVELGRAADQPVGDLAIRAGRALSSAGDRAYALGIFGVAARHYDEALRLVPDTDPERPELLFRLGRARYLGQQGGRKELRAARDGFRAAGDHDRAARVEALLSVHALSHGLAADADAHVTQALDHLGEAGTPSRSRVIALSTRAFLQLTKEPGPAAFAAAREVLAMARALGQPDLIASGLCQIGAGKLAIGDLGGADDLEHGIAMLRRERKLSAAAQWWVVLATGLWLAGDLERSATATAEGRAHTEDWELPSFLPRFDAVKASLDWSAGRWDEVLAFAGDFLARLAAGEGPRLVEPTTRLSRASVLLARGDVEGALADTQALLDLVREAPILSLAQQALALHGRVLLAAGRRDEAAATLDDILTNQRRTPAASAAPPNQVILADDLGQQLPACAIGSLPPTRWQAAATAYVAGDRTGAAARYEAMGALTAAAETRVRAARAASGDTDCARVARAQLRPALAFLRRAGASAWLRETEAPQARASAS